MRKRDSCIQSRAMLRRETIHKRPKCKFMKNGYIGNITRASFGHILFYFEHFNLNLVQWVTENSFYNNESLNHKGLSVYAFVRYGGVLWGVT